jgi:hypothetical protein
VGVNRLDDEEAILRILTIGPPKDQREIPDRVIPVPEVEKKETPIPLPAVTAADRKRFWEDFAGSASASAISSRLTEFL